MARRAGLGKGLDALLPTAPAAASTTSDLETGLPAPASAVAPTPQPHASAAPATGSSIVGVPTPADEGAAGQPVISLLPIDQISANRYQPRSTFDDEALEDLTRSVAELGVLQPVLVRSVDGGQGRARYELIAGERRWRAAQLAGLREIPVVVRDIDDQRSLQEALVENVQREDLNAIEEATAYQQLVDEFSFTQDQVAKAVGRQRSTVANALRLLHLPLSVQHMVVDGSLTAGHARALLGLEGVVRQEEFAARTSAAGLSVRQLEELVRREAEPATKPEPAPRDVERPASLLEVEERLADRLDTRVQVVAGRGERMHGKVVITFADLPDLDRIFRLLVGDEPSIES